jgi:excisionase family DNA binding protein
VTGNAPFPTTPKLLTAIEVATILRVSKQTVYRLVHAGDLAAIRVGRDFRIPEHAIKFQLSAVPMAADTESEAMTAGQ